MVIQLRVKPNSRHESIGFENGLLVLKIREKPVEGKANKAVVEKLAKFFGVAKGCIEIVSGEKSKEKRVRIDCIDDDEILRRLKEA
ncbi:DUF167 domain-containing protein [Hippea alviniae]|uniref:DUF167 domain-containing protein n=1 Tax=Hippea alviniae TaxID=1279027 RepID=UPI0003B76C79|nr:DUF167 domain-containing protein [Hippea alviniae]